MITGAHPHRVRNINQQAANFIRRLSSFSQCRALLMP
jgi:hypothetical protein